MIRRSRSSLLVILPLLLVLALHMETCLGAAGGPCDASCTDKLNCCADQTMGNTCFNTTTHECTANKQICAKGLALCSMKCYDGTLYDCVGTHLCPKGFQLCGSDQCFDTTKYACIDSTKVLRTPTAAECAGLGFNTMVNECINGTLGPIRATTPCAPHQEICRNDVKYKCYDPELYACGTSGVLNALPGFCGQGEVWCNVKCFDPRNYTCQSSGGLIEWKMGDPCPAGQQMCGTVCYNPAAGLVCMNESSVICPTGMGVCNNTCYNTTRYDCMGKEIVMHPGYCPTGLGLCGNRCYNMSAYMCFRDILSPIMTMPCSSSPCLSSDACCADSMNGTVCYEQTYYQCATSDGAAQLCGKGLSLCGTECYDPSVYTCTSGAILCPSGLDYCSTNTMTGCYDKSSFTCLASSVLCPTGGKQCNGACINLDRYICSEVDTIEYVACPRGQLNCAGTCYTAGGKLQCVNHTLVEVDNPTCPSGDCNGTCFDLTRAYCVDGVVVPKPACDDDEDLCFDKCYNTIAQVCEDDTIFVRCDIGMNRCNDTCFDEDTHDCVNGKVVAETCSSHGLFDCGTECYNTTTQNCKDGVVYAKCATGLLDCGRGCYNPDTQECTGGAIWTKCNTNQKRCDNTCYDPTANHCDDGQVKPNSAALVTLSLSLTITLFVCTILIM